MATCPSVEGKSNYENANQMATSFYRVRGLYLDINENVNVKTIGWALTYICHVLKQHWR
ncbi:hypothetical protein QL093DRAFT_2279864 [Fusarium oxysporum]|nr:hypothetical protein BKA60DRAFT_566024 [Fusarium oxysporum]KAJ9423939.1 hypothetical protein QL093DRAFT_2279864 [Fusarium oxysporum]